MITLLGIAEPQFDPNLTLASPIARKINESFQFWTLRNKALYSQITMYNRK